VASHHQAGELHVEQPLFVDPGRDDPMEFIEFRRELAVSAGGNPRGAETIGALQLNRKDLWERRRDRRELLRACVVVLAKATRVELSEDERDDVLRILEAIVAGAADHGEYSSMTRALLRQVAPGRRSWTLPVAALLDALRADAEAGQALRTTEV
jgi:hypothetical protein